MLPCIVQWSVLVNHLLLVFLRYCSCTTGFGVHLSYNIYDDIEYLAAYCVVRTHLFYLGLFL